jgi:ribonuclease PH
MNIVMDENGKFIEVQGTAENSAFSMDELNKMLELAGSGIKSLMLYQVGK